MVQILALSTALLYGAADFTGGLATRTDSAWRTTAWSQLFGAPILIVSVVLVAATEVTGRDLMLGAAAGIFGLVGIVLMYSALATGTMSVVAPIIGTVAAAIPVAWDLATGAVIGPAQWLGIIIAIGAVALLAAQSGGGTVGALPIAKAIAAAVAFAAFFIVMSYTSESAGLWPLVAARSASIPVAFVVAISLSSAALPTRSVLPLVVFTGFADMGANIAILMAVQRGPLGIVAVMSSLYPAVTVVAALVFLKERPRAVQRVGIGMAVVGALILAL